MIPAHSYVGGALLMRGGGGKQGAWALSSEDPNPDSGSLGELPGEAVGIPVRPGAPGPCVGAGCAVSRMTAGSILIAGRGPVNVQ